MCIWGLSVLLRCISDAIIQYVLIKNVGEQKNDFVKLGLTNKYQENKPHETQIGASYIYVHFLTVSKLNPKPKTPKSLKPASPSKHEVNEDG